MALKVVRTAFRRANSYRSSCKCRHTECSWMRGDCDNGNFVALRWVITKENSVCAGSLVLCVCFVDLDAMRSFEGRIFMRIQSGMLGVFSYKSQSFCHRFENGSLALRRLEIVKLSVSFLGKEYFESHLRIVDLR